MTVFKMAKFIGIATLFFAGNLYAQTVSSSSNSVAHNASDKKIPYLYVQTATQGSIVKNNDGKTYTIMLNGVSDETIEFADRPFRSSKVLSTQSFVNNWGTGLNSFAKDHPNAALTYVDKGIVKTLGPVELSQPKYDLKNHALSYQATLNKNSPPLPAQLKVNGLSVFIDDFFNF